MGEIPPVAVFVVVVVVVVVGVVVEVFGGVGVDVLAVTPGVGLEGVVGTDTTGLGVTGPDGV
jgi:ABC-type glucose/galactose transport system permease subunit